MLQKLPGYLAWTRKAVINVLGLATALLTLGLLPDPYSQWVSTAVAVLTIVSHFLTPNAPAPGTAEALEPDDIRDAELDSSYVDPTDVVTASQISVQNEQNQNPPST